MEIGVEIDVEDNKESEITIQTTTKMEQQQPLDPFYVVKRHWKSLVGWSLIVLVLVLAATLPPLFVKRSESGEEQKERARVELSKADVGVQNIIRLAFIPAASLGLWVTGQPNFLHQVDGGVPIEIATSYFEGNSPFQVAARNALDLVSPQLQSGTILGVGLAPHGIISAQFPILGSAYGAAPLGSNLFGGFRERRGVLHSMFADEFTLTGPVRTSDGDISMINSGGLLVTRFPIFYRAKNCSCSNAPTANDVIYRLRGVAPLPLDEFLVGNTTLSSLFEYGSLAEFPERFGVGGWGGGGGGGGGGRFPQEVTYMTNTNKEGPDDVMTMYCDVAYHYGLMGLNLEDYGIQGGLNTSIEYLEECRFFWGFTNIAFDFGLLMQNGGYLDELEAAGFAYMLTKIGWDGEPLILSQSSDFSYQYARPMETNIELPGQTWTLAVVPNNNEEWQGDDWKWQLALAIVGAFFLAFIAFVLVYIVAYRNQYLKNVAEGFSRVTSDAMVQKKRAEASEKVAIENEAVAKKFLSTMSHELRTPLNSILAVSELMMLDLDIENEDPSAPLLPKKGSSSSSVVPSPPSPSTALPSPTTFTSSSPSENSSQFRDCELIHDSARFLKQIVDDVLDFNKIEMGCLVISPNRFSPALALQSVARLATPLIKDPSLYFHLNVDPTTPKTAKTDEHRFKQIIMNLASNAIKFIKEGGLTISLSTVNLTSFVQESLSPSEFQEWTDRLTDCPSMRLQEMATENSGELFIFVDVKDTGPGMTKQQRQEIFQPFFQSDPRRDAQAGGSGLGLSICADLCKALGGVIWATDPKREERGEKEGERMGGRGTSFRFLLPIWETEGQVSSELVESLMVVELGDEEGERGREEEEEGVCVIESLSEEVREQGGSVHLTLERCDNGVHSTTSSSSGPLNSPSSSSSFAYPSSPDAGETTSLLPSSPPSPPLLRVLLIDDSALNRLVFERMLRSLLPCEVDQSATGEEGIQKALERKEEKKEYALVICDLNMGEGKTGVEVGRELKSKLGYEFVMALFTADVMVELGTGEGVFEGVLYKPLSREFLVEFLVRHLDGKYFPQEFSKKLKKKKKSRR